MEEQIAPIQLDPLLLPFVEAPDESAAGVCLEELLASVSPTIRKIVGRKIVSGAQSSEDDCQESLQQIIKALWQCRANPQQHAIGDFRRYVMVVASHVARHHLRAEHPAYHSLRESLRHLLRSDSRFALWERDRDWVCGLATHQNQLPATSTNSRLSQLLQQPLAYDEVILPGRDAQSVAQADLLQAIFVWLGHAVAFDQLVKIFFALRRVEEFSPLADTDDEDARSWSEILPGTEPPQDEEAVWRQFLEKLWLEIEQLPPLQRIAYLLNFTAGDGSLEIFWLHGVASVRRIGQTVGLSEEQFARVWENPAMPMLDDQTRQQAARLTDYDEKFALLWRYLPLNDLVIARLIGTERQKVINLRKSAGDRLARRLAIFKLDRGHSVRA